MTDEEAREDIRIGHGFRPDWLIESLLACYDRYRAKGLSPPDSARQANLYYLASHAAASFDAETGLYSAI
jgi:hypothetical protein